MEINILEYALNYIKKGYSIIPVGRGEDKKEPFLPSYLEFFDRKPTEEEVRLWWKQYPEAQIGILTGKINNLTVLDVDYNEKGKVESGLAYHGDFPKTLTVQSGSGGKHFYYKYCEKADGLKNLRPRIDIKSNHGYVIAPPSLHKSGKRYEWIEKIDPKPFPEFLLDGNNSKANKISIKDIIFGVGEGGRNIAAASLTGLCVKMKLSPEETYQFMVGWNLQCEPPLSDRELKTVIDSIYKTDERRNGTQEDKLIHLAEASEEHKKEYSGTFFKTGFDKIDTALKGGIKVGDLGVISGHSGVGKTLCAQVISSAVLKHNQPVVWFEYELMPDEFWDKFQAMGIDRSHAIYVPKTLKTGQIEWIEQKVIEGVAKGAHLVFIDLLDFIKPKLDEDRKRVSFNQASYVTLVCQQLKELAKLHKVAIVLMAHTRKPPSGASKEPDEFDLKDSGGIMQHSDWVLIIHRMNESELSNVLPNTLRTPRKNPENAFDFSDEDTEYSKLKLRKNRRDGKKPTVVVKYLNGNLKEVGNVSEILLE